MVRKIEKDNTRFKQIVRGRIKKELRKYITKGELIGRKGKNLVSIPLPQIDIPRFKYGPKQTGGVGQGDGDVGTPIAGDPNQPGQGNGAGETPGEHILEVDVELGELLYVMLAGGPMRVGKDAPDRKPRPLAQLRAFLGGAPLPGGLEPFVQDLVDERFETAESALDSLDALAVD